MIDDFVRDFERVNAMLLFYTASTGCNAVIYIQVRSPS